jgi:RNA polymerase sigma factor (sigma-70 family)
MLSTFGFTTYLSNNQWLAIRNILKNPTTTPETKSRVHYILYKQYSEYAINKAYSFSKYNKIHNNRKLDSIELSNYALRGLHKAVLRYNATYTFHNHVNLYIQSELYNGLTELQPINGIPSYIRKNKKWKNYNMKQYLNALKTQFIGDDESFLDNVTKRYNKPEYNYDEIDILTKVKSMGPLYYEIYKLKYYNKKMSNHKMGQLLSCSEETVRCKLKKIREVIQSE